MNIITFQNLPIKQNVAENIKIISQTNERRRTRHFYNLPEYKTENNGGHNKANMKIMLQLK